MEFLINEYDSDAIDAINEKHLSSYLKRDERNIDDPLKFRAASLITGWYGNGTNHRVENGNIVRDIAQDGWFVEINTLEELLVFKQRYGSIVIRHESGLPMISFLDDYL